MSNDNSKQKSGGIILADGSMSSGNEPVNGRILLSDDELTKFKDLQLAYIKAKSVYADAASAAYQAITPMFNEMREAGEEATKLMITLAENYGVREREGHWELLPDEGGFVRRIELESPPKTESAAPEEESA